MYAFIDCNRGRYTVGMMAKLLGVSPRSYYDFKNGVHSKREQKREQLELLIQSTYVTANRRTKQRQRLLADYAMQGGGKLS